MLENCDDSTKKIMNFFKKNPKVLPSLHFATNLSYLVKSLTYIKYLLSFQAIFKGMWLYDWILEAISPIKFYSLGFQFVY